MTDDLTWRDRALMLTPPMPWDRPQWHDVGGPTVVLLHGLWRSRRAMQPLASTLQRQGFSTLNIPYPSARLSIPRLVEHLRTQIAKVVEDQPIHFITHSLGGIMVRALLLEEVSWKFGKIVMLAPPNQGSEIVDWSRKVLPLRLALGPAGRALGSDGAPSTLSAIPNGIDAAVVMGKRSIIPHFNKLLGDENDGIVSVEGGRIEGLCGFSVVDADHTFIQSHPETLRLTLHFLRTGEWLT